MKNYKVYGNEKTNLVLTPKAQAVYSVTDPLEIREFCTEDGEYTYDLVGCLEAHGIPSAEVNSVLEDLATIYS